MTAIPLAYQDLAPATRRALGVLCQWPGPHLTVCTAAALRETGIDDTEELFDELSEAGVAAAISAGRYVIPPQVRERALADVAEDEPAEQVAALARGINHLVLTAAAADLRLSPYRPRHGWAYVAAADTGRPAFPTTGRASTWLDVVPQVDSPAFPDAESALVWLDTEVLNLLAAQKAAGDIGRPELACAVPETLESWLESRRNHEVWGMVCDQGLNAACGDRPDEPGQGGFCMAETRMRILLARAHRDLGDHRQARVLLPTAIKVARSVGDRLGVAMALIELGAVHIEAGQPDEAIPAVNAALDTMRTVPAGTVWLLALAHRRLGTAFGLTGDFDRAREEFTPAVNMAAALGEHEHGCALTELGATELAAGDLEAATTALSQAAATLENCGRPYSLARAHTLLAEAYDRHGDRELARLQIKEALEIYHVIDAPVNHPAHAAARRHATTLSPAHDA